MVGSSSAAAVAVGEEDELTVGMPVKVELDTLASLEGGEVVKKSLVLGGVTLGSTTVGLRARAGGRARAGPLVGPVSVDIGSEARGARPRLSVLSPETLSGSVDET